MDDLPADYDAIIVGTGMVESIIAAALSRIGKSVLHLDSNEYYGDDWASFNLNGFENWSKRCNKNNVHKVSNESFNYLIHENEKIVEIHPNINVWNTCLNNFLVNKKKVEKHKEVNITKVQEEIVAEDVISSENSENNARKSLETVEENLQKLSRKFNLDLCPKLIFSKGMLVQLLIKSNIAKYAEFKSVNHVLTWRQNQLEPVPCSRADVFATKNITVVHKRFLVKILTLFANYIENLDEFKGFENKTFLEYLKHKKLPENLIHYILYAIAMADHTTSCMEGVKSCKTFLESLGRYGNTPFIFPMYGSGELPQCFCRLCAVFGGTYCLQRGIEALIVRDNLCVGVISNKKRLNTKAVILSTKFAPKDYLVDENIENISRGIFITDRSIQKNDKDSLTLLLFPPISKISDKSVTVIELGSGTCTCPENYFVVHMTTKMTKDAYSDLKHVAQALFEPESDEDSKPKILWFGTWNVSRITSKSNNSCARNVKICSTVDSEFDYDLSIDEAKKIFKELYPEEEFLPRAPDPDEIVLDVDEMPSEYGDFVEKKQSNPGNSREEKSAGGSDTAEKNSTKIDVAEESKEKQSCDINKPNEKDVHSSDS